MGASRLLRFAVSSSLLAGSALATAGCGHEGPSEGECCVNPGPAPEPEPPRVNTPAPERTEETGGIDEANGTGEVEGDNAEASAENSTDSTAHGSGDESLEAIEEENPLPRNVNTAPDEPTAVPTMRQRPRHTINTPVERRPRPRPRPRPTSNPVPPSADPFEAE